MNAIAEAAARFTSRIEATVAEITAQGTIFSRKVRRALIIEDAGRNHDIDNCIGDLVKAAMVAKEISPAQAAYYQDCIDVIGEARVEISRRQIARMRAEREANPGPADAGGPFPIAD